MKKIILIMLFLFLINIALADDLFLVESIKLDVNISSKLKINRGDTSYIKAELSFYPKDTWRQNVLNMDIYPIVEPENELINFKWANPHDKEVIYFVNSEVRTYNKFRKVKTKVDFPISDLEKEYSNYTKPEELIDINDDITELAAELAEGEDDSYFVAVKLASWVNKNINYSLSTFTAEASRESSWVLDNKKGVCDEITNLFISLCRSLGIPARFVSGYAYTNSPLFENEWGAHGWAEVYFPRYGWVPFDVTYGQFGYLDAGHIKFKDTIDSDKSSVNYEWKGRNVDIDTTPLVIETEIKEKGEALGDLFELEAKPFAKKINFGSYNLVELNVENEHDYYISAGFSLYASDGLDIISEQKQFLVLKPKGSRKVFWKIKITDNLDKASIYTFPLVIHTLRNQSTNLEFKAIYEGVEYNKKEIDDILKNKVEEDKKTYSKNMEFSCRADEVTYVNKTFSIICVIKNIGNTNLEDIEVCLNDNCKKTDLTIMKEKEFVFNKTITGLGQKNIIITAKNNEISRSLNLNLDVVEKPLIPVKGITENLSFLNKISNFLSQLFVKISKLFS